MRRSIGGAEVDGAVFMVRLAWCPPIILPRAWKFQIPRGSSASGGLSHFSLSTVKHGIHVGEQFRLKALLAEQHRLFTSRARVEAVGRSIEPFDRFADGVRCLLREEHAGWFARLGLG